MAPRLGLPSGTLTTVARPTGVAALVGVEQAAADVQEGIGFPHGFQVEVHGAAADQTVAGGDVLVEEVVLELRAAVVAEHFPGGIPDVAFNAAAAQGADAAAVLPHQQHGAGLLGG